MFNKILLDSRLEYINMYNKRSVLMCIYTQNMFINLSRAHAKSSIKLEKENP